MTEAAWCKVTDVFVVDWCRSPLFLSFPCCQLLVFYLRVKSIAECWLAPPEQRGYHSAQEVCTFCRHLLMLMLLMPFVHRVSEHKQRRRFSVVLIHREQRFVLCARDLCSLWRKKKAKSIVLPLLLKLKFADVSTAAAAATSATKHPNSDFLSSFPLCTALNSACTKFSCFSFLAHSIYSSTFLCRL